MCVRIVFNHTLSKSRRTPLKVAVKALQRLCKLFYKTFTRSKWVDEWKKGDKIGVHQKQFTIEPSK